MDPLARALELLAAIAPEAQQKLVAQQFRQASGLLGPLWGWLMNRGNGRMIASAVELLDHGPASHIAEIGVGGGAALQRLLPRLPVGRLTGTELSEVLLEAARRKFARDLRAGRLELVRAAVEQLPCGESSIDAVLTVNTIYFWTAPEEGLAELFRILRPGGQLLIAFRPAPALRRYRYSQHGLTLYAPVEVEALLRQAGFTGIRLVERHDDRLGYCCALSRRP